MFNVAESARLIVTTWPLANVKLSILMPKFFPPRRAGGNVPMAAVYFALRLRIVLACRAICRSVESDHLLRTIGLFWNGASQSLAVSVRRRPPCRLRRGIENCPYGQ
jgi:hypothetical protein